MARSITRVYLACRTNHTKAAKLHIVMYAILMDGIKNVHPQEGQEWHSYETRFG